MSVPPDNQDERQDEWRECPRGELERMVERLEALRTARRRRQIVVTSAVIAMVGAVVVGGRQLWIGSSEFEYGGIACSDVAVLMANYSAGSLDEDLAEKVRLHLHECQQCGPKFQRMFGELAKTALVPRSRLHSRSGNVRFENLATADTTGLAIAGSAITRTMAVQAILPMQSGR